MRAHPAADIFPMVPDDSLQSLAESIKANGLRFPIVVREVPDDDGVIEQEIIDGRNRFRACEIAGVEPTFTVFEGDDDAVRAFIADVNLERRDLKKSQKAMLLATLFPDPERLRRKGSVSATERQRQQVSAERLSVARAVLRHSEALAEDVIFDRVPLDAALVKIKEDQARANSVESKTARLRAGAPDLADLVADERMKLDEALAAMQERERIAAEEERSKRETFLRLTESAYRGSLAWAVDDFVSEVRERLSDAEFKKQLAERLRFDPKTIKEIQKGAKAVAAVLALIGGEHD